MNKYKRLKIGVFVLSLIVIIETILLFNLWLSRPKKAPAVTKIPAAIKGRIAIVLDDWGYNLNNLHILDEIKYPLTMSVLPHLNYSQAIAKELHRRGFEIILHLPLEPREKFRLEQNTIMASMSEESIVNIINRDLVSVSKAMGVSNHMGSRATEDKRTMTIIFKELGKRNLYFLDGVVSPKSICSDLARQMHILFAKRDVFLDNEEESQYIREQIHKLKTKAGIYGQAIGIGHDRKITLEVLKDAMPELEKEGYKFVFVSQLVK